MISREFEYMAFLLACYLHVGLVNFVQDASDFEVETVH